MQVFLEKKFTKAIEVYSKILEINPQNLIVLNNIGYALSKVKKFDLETPYVFVKKESTSLITLSRIIEFLHSIITLKRGSVPVRVKWVKIILRL